MEKSDPLKDPQFKKAGFGEKLAAAFFGLSRPFDCLQIEVSSYCMGKCLYCPHTTWADEWNSRHMEARTFARLWPLLKRAQRAHLQGWGEPLVNPRFFDFASFAQKAGAQVSTTTCGYVMNDSLAEKIAQSGMDVIAFSLAGTDSESNSVRANIDFERVCASIELLRKKIRELKRGPEIHLAYILLADRIDAAANLPELMAKLDVPMAVVSTLDFVSVPEHAGIAILPGETGKISHAASVLEKARQEAEKDGRIIHFALPSPNVANDGGCRENIVKTLYVDAEGNLSPCVYLNTPVLTKRRHKVFGNINEKDPLELWRDPRWQGFRENILTPEPDPVCENCPKRNEQEMI